MKVELIRLNEHALDNEDFTDAKEGDTVYIVRYKFNPAPCCSIRKEVIDELNPNRIIVYTATGQINFSRKTGISQGSANFNIGTSIKLISEKTFNKWFDPDKMELDGCKVTALN